MIGKIFIMMFGGCELSIEMGKFVKLVSGSVIVCYGDILLLVIVQVSDIQSKFDFLLLMVEFEECYYVVGKIFGFFQCCEGCFGEKVIFLVCIIDCQICLLFFKGYCYEMQVIIMVFFVDGQNVFDVLGLIGVVVVLSISDIFWVGLIVCVCVGQIDGQYVVNFIIE